MENGRAGEARGTVVVAVYGIVVLCCQDGSVICGACACACALLGVVCFGCALQSTITWPEGKKDGGAVGGRLGKVGG